MSSVESKPFIALFEEKPQFSQEIEGVYDPDSQMIDSENVGITHYETKTGGHGDTDTDSD